MRVVRAVSLRRSREGAVEGVLVMPPGQVRQAVPSLRVVVRVAVAQVPEVPPPG